MSSPARTALSLLVVVAGCTEGGTLPSPTVRVDLSPHLPRKVQRRLAAADTSYECHRKLTVEGEGARQAFIVTWRVFEADAGQRHITAVQVDPDGPFTGARGPRASAAVDPVKGGKGVSVRVGWQATRGCGTIKASNTLALRPDDPRCKPPKPAGKIFTK